VSQVITKEELRTGDALLAWGAHVRLFEHWTDTAHTTYLACDFGATPCDACPERALQGASPRSGTNTIDRRSQVERLRHAAGRRPDLTE